MKIAEPLRVGDIVRCIKSFPHRDPRITVPEIGQLYTIRGWDPHFEGSGVYLEEIQNYPSKDHPYSRALRIEPFFYWWQFEVIRRFPFEGLRDGALNPPYHLICKDLSFRELIEMALPEFGVYSISWNSEDRRKNIEAALLNYADEYDYSYLTKTSTLFGIQYSDIDWLGKGKQEAVGLLGRTIVPIHLYKRSRLPVSEASLKKNPRAFRFLEEVLEKRAIPIFLPSGVHQVFSLRSGAICATSNGIVCYITRNKELMNSRLEIIGSIS